MSREALTTVADIPLWAFAGELPMTPWDLPPRMRNKLAVNEAGCWVWTGSRNSKGYGLTSIGGKPVLAHRRSYELLAGEIPEGYTIDHRECKVTRCINPAHLEPVTLAENLTRAADDIQRTSHYPCGHPRTPENTQIKRRSDGYARVAKACRECNRLATRRAYHARKAAA